MRCLLAVRGPPTTFWPTAGEVRWGLMRITRRIAGTLALGALLWALAPIALGSPLGGDALQTAPGAGGDGAALEGPDAPEVRISLDQLRYQSAAKRVRTDTPGLYVAAALLLLLGARFIGFRGTGAGSLRTLRASAASGRAPPPALALS